MKPKILKRQSEILSNQNENAARPITPAKGTITRFGVVTFLERAIAAPTATTTAIVVATIRNKLISSKSLGNRTIMAAPNNAPKRDLRPPIMTANKKSTASSLL